MVTSMRSLRLPSYAKINLGLNILGKRDDGFHELQTVLQQIDLHDEIALRLSAKPGIRFSCDTPSLPVDDSNLCVRAFRLLEARHLVKSGVEIELSKRIPAGAGLGGGSGNAAVVLLGLNSLWDLGLSVNQLEEMAAELGSDVPFFIQGGTAFATGRGEQLESVALPVQPGAVLVVFAGIHVSTAWAYRNLNSDLTMSKKDLTLTSFKDKIINDVEFFRLLRNDFEAHVFAEHAVLGEIKRLLCINGALFASLSGSGSAVFGLFDCESDATRVESLFPGHYRTFVSAFIKWGYAQLA